MNWLTKLFDYIDGTTSDNYISYEQKQLQKENDLAYYTAKCIIRIEEQGEKDRLFIEKVDAKVLELKAKGENK